jgi:formamidopyrimidine-DNA glycosylase
LLVEPILRSGAHALPPMPELPELEGVRDVLHRRLLGQTIVSAESIPPGAAIVIRDLTGAGFGSALAGARFESIVRRGKFLVFNLAAADVRRCGW